MKEVSVRLCDNSISLLSVEWMDGERYCVREVHRQLGLR